MSTPPTLPPLEGQLLLDVFTHRTIPPPPGAPDTEYGDSERVASLGKRVLQMVVAHVLFRKRPMLPAADLESAIDETLSFSNIDGWVSTYMLRERMSIAPEDRDSLANLDETHLIFNSYVGAVYYLRGLSTVERWIGQLVDPDYEVPTDEPPNPVPPSLPPSSPSQSTAPPAYSGPTTDTGRKYLPTFNELCMQHAIIITWNARAEGQAHMLSWTVDCYLDGVHKGTGTARSKQAAKEEAAKQAYHAKGWN